MERSEAGEKGNKSKNRERPWRPPHQLRHVQDLPPYHEWSRSFGTPYLDSDCASTARLRGKVADLYAPVGAGQRAVRVLQLLEPVAHRQNVVSGELECGDDIPLHRLGQPLGKALIVVGATLRIRVPGKDE